MDWLVNVKISISHFLFWALILKFNGIVKQSMHLWFRGKENNDAMLSSNVNSTLPLTCDESIVLYLNPTHVSDRRLEFRRWHFFSESQWGRWCEDLILESLSSHSSQLSGTLVRLYPDGTFSCFTCKTVISAVPPMRCHVFCPFEFMIFMALKHIGQFEMLKNLRGSKTIWSEDQTNSCHRVYIEDLQSTVLGSAKLVVAL